MRKKIVELVQNVVPVSKDTVRHIDKPGGFQDRRSFRNKARPRCGNFEMLADNFFGNGSAGKNESRGIQHLCILFAGHESDICTHLLVPRSVAWMRTNEARIVLRDDTRDLLPPRVERICITA